MKTRYATHHLRVHETIDKEMNCTGKEQMLMWGAQVDLLLQRRNGRSLIRWNDGVREWFGWTYKESLAKSLDEIF